MNHNIFRSSRLVFKNGSEAMPDVQVEAPEPQISQKELIKRDRDIKSYFSAAYGGFCYDFDSAAKKNGFKNRSEADKYLSKLTGSNYGEKLKTMDVIVDPRTGEDNYYFATARDTHEFFKDKDFLNKDMMMPMVEAHIIAEDAKFPLNVTSMAAIHIYMLINRNPDMFTTLKNRDSISRDGAVIEKASNDYFYNSNVNANNLWGKLDGGEDYYVKNEGRFVKVEKREAWHSTGGTVYTVNETKTVFDERGNYSDALSNEWKDSEKRHNTP